MSIDNRNYYRARAEQELTAASVATDPTSAAIHADLAKLYQARANGPIEDDDFRLAEDGVVADSAGDANNFRQIPQSGPA